MPRVAGPGPSSNMMRPPVLAKDRPTFPLRRTIVPALLSVWAPSTRSTATGQPRSNTTITTSETRTPPSFRRQISIPSLLTFRKRLTSSRLARTTTLAGCAERSTLRLDKTRDRSRVFLICSRAMRSPRPASLPRICDWRFAAGPALRGSHEPDALAPGREASIL